MTVENNDKIEHHLHDENFKMLFSTSVKNFVKLFFNDFYHELDTHSTWQTVSEDVTSEYKFFTKDLGKYFVDRAFLANAKDGETQYVLHFEFQTSDDDMDSRARHYNNLLSAMFKEHIVLTFVITMRDFPKGKTSKSYKVTMDRFGLNAKKIFEYDLINLRSDQYSWDDSQFLNEEDPNPMAIALWGLIEDNRSIEKNGVSMMLKGFELLLKIQKNLTNEEEIIRPFKFLADYIFPKLTAEQRVEFEQGIRRITEGEKGEQIKMSLIETVQTIEKVMKQKRESTRLVESLIVQKLESVSYNNIPKIKAQLDDIFDENVIVRAYNLLEEDPTGNSLEEYLKNTQ